MTKTKEIAIIGAGIAGVSAAVYAKRAGLDFYLFEPKAVGGQILFMENIDNYPGIGVGTKGRDLARQLNAILEKLEIKPLIQEVSSLQYHDETITLATDEANYTVRAAIIATGASFRKLGVRGEARLCGKGVSYCAVCDGFFFRNKEVAVVGGGNTAAEEALYLSEIASKVTLIHRRDSLRALAYLQKRLFAKKNIEIRFNSIVQEIEGTDCVRQLRIADTQGIRQYELPLQGVFIAIGIEPNTSLVRDFVSCDEAGFILTDEYMQASLPCLWACGDCRRRPLKQLVTAASEGAIAAMGAYKYLKGHYISA